MNGEKAPIKPKRHVRRGGSFPGKGQGRMKFSKLELRAARKELNKERYEA